MIQITPQMRKCGAPHFRIYVKPPDMWSRPEPRALRLEVWRVAASPPASVSTYIFDAHRSSSHSMMVSVPPTAFGGRRTIGVVSAGGSTSLVE
jgi:hypothetical protein